MRILPDAEELQSLIDRTHKAVVTDAAETNQVIRTILCYVPNEGFEFYAVIDADGGDSFQVGDVTVTTISKRTPLVQSLLNAWIGEAVPAGGDILVVAAHGGMEMPEIEECAAAFQKQNDIQKLGAELRLEFASIKAELQRRELDYNAQRRRLASFDELHDAVKFIDSQLSDLRRLTALLEVLFRRPLSRTMGSLMIKLEEESSGLSELRTYISAHGAENERILKPWRDKYVDLDAKRRKLESYRAAEKARINLLYIESLRDPAPIIDEEALAEYDEIVVLADEGDADRGVIVKRLHILRSRCLRARSIRGCSEPIESLIAKADARIGIAQRVLPEEPVQPLDEWNLERIDDSSSGGVEQLAFDW
jgi:hypothetical protein